MDEDLRLMESEVMKRLKGRFVDVNSDDKKRELVESVAKTLMPNIDQESIDAMLKDMDDLGPLNDLLNKSTIEDIMVNNTSNIFVYDSAVGERKVNAKVAEKEDLALLVDKLKLYATNETSKGNILDVHMRNGSRANIVASPLGYDITIRNFKMQAMSILDLINLGVMDYQIAARLWVYVDGFRVRPANMLIGGMPAAGKTTLLNAMFSFFRPEARIVTIEETYELNTETQENCVRLETSEDMTTTDLVKNALRMRPDMIIIGEVRGEEANDMMTAMNIGKISMGTIHASSTRDMINRLQHAPMNVPKDIIPVIDALIILAQVYEKNKPSRKIVQISEISGMETQILLSDLYKFDYKTHKAAPILPSVTYRDTLSTVLGVPPPDILAEENVRANILFAMNKQGTRDMVSINNIVKEYYDNPEATLKKLGLSNMQPVIKV